MSQKWRRHADVHENGESRIENEENSRTNRIVRKGRERSRGNSAKGKANCEYFCINVFIKQTKKDKYKLSYCFRVEELRRYCQETCYKLAIKEL